MRVISNEIVHIEIGTNSTMVKETIKVTFKVTIRAGTKNYERNREDGNTAVASDGYESLEVLNVLVQDTSKK